MTQETKHIPSLNPIKHPNILLVDDNESINFFNKVMIQKFDNQINITSSRNGLEALKQVKLLFKQSSYFDIIFLDINMPVMDGWEFLNELNKENLLSKDSKIVFTIGRELNNEDKTRISEYNINYLFSKKMISKDILTELITF